MERVILQGSNKPSPQEGQNGNYYVQVKDTKIVLWGPKQNGHWPLGFEVDMPKGEKGEPGKDGKDGRDGMDGFTRLTSGDHTFVKGSGTPKDPYSVNVKDHETIESFEYDRSKGEITLITSNNSKFRVSLKDLQESVKENTYYINQLENRNNTYYLSDTIVPLGIPLSKRGGERDGVSTGNYFVVPHTSLFKEITWTYLAAGEKHHTIEKIFRPHNEMGGKRPVVSIDVYADKSLIIKGVIPNKPFKLINPEIIEGGSIIYFDVNIKEGTPYGMTVTMGFESIAKESEFINK